jgi:hypothetical protein
LDIVLSSSQVFSGFTKVKPSAAVLFINGIGDPVAPPSAARQMSGLFEGSGVVVVDGPGHGHTEAPSDCANQAIAAYSENGTVPTEELLCETSVDADFYFGDLFRRLLGGFRPVTDLKMVFLLCCFDTPHVKIFLYL